MRNVDKAMEWLENQSKHPTQSWKGLCQSSTQRLLNASIRRVSQGAWGNVNKKFKTEITNYKDKEWWQSVPRGAILYSAPHKVWTRLGSSRRHDCMVC